MLRSAWLAPLSLVLGCASGAASPPPATQKLAVVETAKPPPAAPEKPEPQVLPEVKVDLKPYARHVEARISRFRARPVDDELLAEKLPKPWRARFEAALAGTKKLEKAHEPVAEAYFAELSCSDPCAAAQAKYDRAKRAFDKQAEAITRAHDKIVEAFTKQHEKTPSVELALALARLHDESRRQGDIVVMNRPAELGLDYGDRPLDNDGRSAMAALVLDGAKNLFDASAELGPTARYQLMIHRWNAGEHEDALTELEALLAKAGADQKYELHARHGLLLGASGEHLRAAEAFSRALSEPETKDEPVQRSELSVARIVAQYRAGRWSEALVLALPELDRSSPNPFSFASHPELRIAADCIERLGKEVDGVRAKDATKASLLGELALRALHRHDQKRATELASRALELSEASAEEAFKVLIAVAKQKGDAARASELEARKLKARPRAAFASGILGLLGAKSDPAFDEESALGEDAKPDAKRNVASLVRLCLEPSFWKLPERGGKEALDLVAKLKDDGSIEVEVSGEAPAAISDCLRAMGPKVLARAPGSIRAHLDLSQARSSGSLFGSAGLGNDVAGALGGLQGFGAGGLGVRGSGLGGGGTDSGIGLGSIGVRGKGGGAGKGYGGSLRPGAKPPVRPAPKKKP